MTFFMFPQNENESSVFFYWWENKIYPPYLKKRSSSPYFEFRPVRTLEKIHKINSNSVLVEKYDLPFKQILLHILFKFVFLPALQSKTATPNSWSMVGKVAYMEGERLLEFLPYVLQKWSFCARWQKLATTERNECCVATPNYKCC